MSNKTRNDFTRRVVFSGVPREATTQEYVEYFRRELETMNQIYEDNTKHLENRIAALEARLTQAGL